MKNQFLVIGLALTGVLASGAWADDAAKTAPPVKPVTPVATPAQPAKTATPAQPTTQPAKTAVPAKQPEPQKAPAATQATGKTAQPAAGDGGPTLLARRIDRYSLAHQDCAVWSDGTITIDVDSDGIKPRYTSNLNLDADSLQALNAKLRTAYDAPWVDHRGMFANSITPDQWGILYQAYDKPVYSVWGAIWIGARDSATTLEVKHFLDYVCVWP